MKETTRTDEDTNLRWIPRNFQHPGDRVRIYRVAKRQVDHCEKGQRTSCLKILVQTLLNQVTYTENKHGDTTKSAVGFEYQEEH
eukprot:scaffold659_cov192-Ochromonas_danica.AAC.9